MVTFLASILIWLMFFGLIILWIIDGKIKKEIVVHAVISAVIVWIITEVIKTAFPITRPFELNGLQPLTLTTPNNGAFPSTHAAVSFALSTSVFLHHKKVGILYLVLALIVGVNRIIAQVHYPVDIVVGAVLGIVTSFIVNKKHFFKVIN